MIDLISNILISINTNTIPLLLNTAHKIIDQQWLRVVMINIID